MGNPVPASFKFITVRSMQILPNTVALTAATKPGAKISLYTGELILRFIFLYPCMEPFFLKFKLQI
jgi:hypothetical protein